MRDRIRFGALLLVGGRSTRMGQDKALLPLGQEPMLLRLAGQLTDFDERLLSAGTAPRESLPGFRTVQDRYPGAGPLAGLHAALSETEADALLTVPCDLPYFTAEAARVIVSAFSPEVDALLCRDGTGRLHPLSGVYARHCLPVIEAQLSRGQYRMGALFQVLNCAVLDTAPFLPDTVFFNMNTPDDYRSVRSTYL